MAVNNKIRDQREPRRLIRKASIMRCGGLGGSRPPVQRLTDEGETRPADIPLTLTLIVSEYATRLLVHQLPLVYKVGTDDLIYIYEPRHPADWTGFFF